MGKYACIARMRVSRIAEYARIFNTGAYLQYAPVSQNCPDSGACAAQPYESSREDAHSMAEMIHRITELRVPESRYYGSSVTIAAVRLYNQWRVSNGLPEVDHQLCAIHIINLVWKAFDTKLMAPHALGHLLTRL
jgi:hypothetical protein